MRKWIIFFISGILTLGSIALIIDQHSREDYDTRGWEQATRTRDLPMNRPALPGINVELTQYTPTELDAQLDAIATLGFVWLRQPFYWANIEPESNEVDWTLYDPIVEAVTAHPQLELIALLDGTPRWARDSSAPDHAFAPPASAKAFGNFARAVAERYGDSIDHYQIWDEPNLRSHWGSTDPAPAIYVAMLQQAYTKIHNSDPDAHVIAAALAPTVEEGPQNYNEIDYFYAMYVHGAQGYFDGAAGKPYGYNVGPYDRNVGQDTFNFSRLILMREQMVDRGDADKPIWGSNFGWNHLPSDWRGPPSIWGQVSAEEQVRFTHEAFQRANEEWPWLAGLILQHWQPDAPPDDPIQGFAVAPHLDRWQGPVFTSDALRPGLHDVQNPYTTFEGAWQFGPLGADALPVDPNDPNAQTLENTVTIDFYGTEFGLIVRRYAVITGYYIVSIDGANANELPINKQGESYIVLKSVQGGEEVDVILAASDLELGHHTAVITHRPRQGDDAWAMAGIAVAVGPDTTPYERLRLIAYGLATLGALGIVLTIYRIPWRQIRLPSRDSLINMSDAILTLTLTSVLMVGTALSWNDLFTGFFRRDPPAIAITLTTVGLAYFSPVVLITLLALLIFGLVVFNRPVMGLAAVVFWSMFFTSTLDVAVQLVTVVEMMLIISAAAIFGRNLYEAARAKKVASLFKHHTHTLDIAMLAFATLSVISITWADLRSEAIHELRVMVLGPVLFYFLVRSLPPSKQDLSMLVDTAIIGGTVIALLGLTNFVQGDVIEADGSRRLIAVYGSPNGVALQLGRCLPFAFAYAILPLGEWRRVFGAITGIIMLVALILTQSIGSLALGLPAAFAIMLLAWQGRRAWRWLAALGAAAIAILIPLSRFIPRLRNLTDFESSTTLFRLNLWRSTIEMLKDHPFTGVGLDQFLYFYRSRYILPEGSADPDLSHPHNVLFDYWVRLGVLGVLIGIWLQIAFWRTALMSYLHFRDKDHLLLAILIGTMGLMANFLAHGLVDAAYFFINLSFMFALAMALVQRLASVASAGSRLIFA